LSPTPSEVTTPEPGGEHSDLEVSEYEEDETVLPSSQPQPHPLSATLEDFTDYARKVESGFPPDSTPKVIEALRSHVAQGNFGELRQLFFPPPPPAVLKAEDQPPVQKKVQSTSKNAVQEDTKMAQYPYIYRPPMQHQSQLLAPSYPFSAGTVNPSTLNVENDSVGPFNLADTLAIDTMSHNSFDSGSTMPNDFQSGMAYVFFILTISNDSLCLSSISPRQDMSSVIMR
jgi:hypothetical protein